MQRLLTSALSSLIHSPQLRQHPVPWHLLPCSTGPAKTSIRHYSSNPPSSSPLPIPTLTHLTPSGAAHMVDISSKQPTTRQATATATLLFSKPETHAALTTSTLKKGDAIAVARIAAIQAAKKTAELIPLAHPSLSITAVNVEIEPFTSESDRGEEVDSEPSSGGNREGVSGIGTGNSSRGASVHGGVEIYVTVKCDGKTGVEMEALTAATVGALTTYDMLKGIDKGMIIGGARVVEKWGGKSGHWRWSKDKGRVEKVDSEERGEERPGIACEQVAEDGQEKSRRYLEHLATRQVIVREIEQRQENGEGGERRDSKKMSEVDEWNQGLKKEFGVDELPEDFNHGMR